MNPIAFPLLADENVHPEVIQSLSRDGKDVLSVIDEGLGGCPDRQILRKAHDAGRVVLTHDGDFGALAVRDGEALTGIIYIRPGHIRADFVLDVLKGIEASDLDVTPPFLLVAERRDTKLRVRVRSLTD